MTVTTQSVQFTLLACGALITGCDSTTKSSAATRAGAPAARASGATGAMPDMPGMTGMQMRTDGSALLSASTVKQFGITFDTAAVRELQATLRTTGTVAVDESGVVAVTTKVGGFIERRQSVTG